jgi:hypothetical protein
MAERMRQDAVIRKLEIIGEAVKQFSNATKESRPEIPWKQIAGMRDRLTHDYFGVDLALVLRVQYALISPSRRPAKLLEVAPRTATWVIGDPLRRLRDPGLEYWARSKPLIADSALGRRVVGAWIERAL